MEICLCFLLLITELHRSDLIHLFKDPVEIGEQVYVLIYRLYIFDENQTYLVENKEMQEGEVFYI